MSSLCFVSPEEAREISEAGIKALNGAAIKLQMIYQRKITAYDAERGFEVVVSTEFREKSVGDSVGWLFEAEIIEGGRTVRASFISCMWDEEKNPNDTFNMDWLTIALTKRMLEPRLLAEHSAAA